MIKAHTVQSVYTFSLRLPLYLISLILKDEHKSIIFTWTYMHTYTFKQQTYYCLFSIQLVAYIVYFSLMDL